MQPSPHHIVLLFIATRYKNGRLPMSVCMSFSKSSLKYPNFMRGDRLVESISEVNFLQNSSHLSILPLNFVIDIFGSLADEDIFNCLASLAAAFCCLRRFSNSAFRSWSSLKFHSFPVLFFHLFSMLLKANSSDMVCIWLVISSVFSSSPSISQLLAVTSSWLSPFEIFFSYVVSVSVFTVLMIAVINVCCLSNDSVPFLAIISLIFSILKLSVLIFNQSISQSVNQSITLSISLYSSLTL